MRVYTDGGMVEIVAPHTFITQPGTKRVILALTKAVWTTYHHNPTNTEDQDKLEAINIAQSYTDLIEQE